MKRLTAILFALIIFIAGCGLLPPTPDANNGLVKIRIPNPRMQQAGYELSAIPEDTETIGVRVEGPNPALVQVKSFGNSPYIEFSFLLPAPGEFEFYIIGSSSNKILTCFGHETVSIQAGISNEAEIHLRTYTINYSAISSTRMINFCEPKYSLQDPREVFWGKVEGTLSFTGDGLAVFYKHFMGDYPQNYLFEEYSLDKWKEKTFWLKSKTLTWSEVPESFGYNGGLPNLICNLRTKGENTLHIINATYGEQFFPIYVPLVYKDNQEPYYFESGSVYLSVPVKWAAFNNMEAGFVLPTKIDLLEFIGEVTIVIK